MFQSLFLTALAVVGVAGRATSGCVPCRVAETNAYKPLTSDFPTSINPLTATIKDIDGYLSSNKVSSEQLVKEYLARIERDNRQGLKLRAMIETAPYENVVKIAADLDVERKSGKMRGPLHGIPIVLKDNIATEPSLGMNTTAGSFALLPENAGSPKADSTVVAQLRRAGAIILGKANLSEWAMKRGGNKNGWSGRGGQTQSPYVLGGPTGPQGADPSGSSTGSASAVAAGWAAAALGTETDGSITGPSSVHALYSLKPSVGMTSRGGVVPFSQTQDSVGPMCKSTWDVAVLMNVMKTTAVDDRDKDATSAALMNNATAVEDYTKFLTTSFKGIKLGLPMKEITLNYTLFDLLGITKMGFVDPVIPGVTMKTLKKIESFGATVLYDDLPVPAFGEIAQTYPKTNESVVLNYEFKHYVEQYLATLSDTVPKSDKEPLRTLKDLIRFNNEHKDIEMPEGQCCQLGFDSSEATSKEGLDSQEYKDALRWNRDKLGRELGIDFLFNRHPELTALVLPSDPLAAMLPAIAGYPIATVPMGTGKNGAPFGLSFIGRRFDEGNLVRIMSAYEANFPKRPVPKNVR